MKIALLIAVVTVAFGNLCSGQQAASLKLPCKTPEELSAALKTVLEKNDTNSFWKLHCWTNVNSTSEKVWKATSLDAFNLNELGSKVSFSGFAVRPIPPEYNTPRKLPRGGQIQPNIPATGMITYKIKSRNVDVSAETAFGKGPDGNYWLVVETKTTSTNAPPATAR